MDNGRGLEKIAIGMGAVAKLAVNATQGKAILNTKPFKPLGSKASKLFGSKFKSPTKTPKPTINYGMPKIT